MASKRAEAIKRAKRQEAIADRMAAIEANQKLIMEALGIKEIPGVEGETIEEPVDYGAMSVADLIEAAMDHGIYDSIIGTGKDGNIIKADLVEALTEFNEALAE